jgi:hypothetical protein
MDWSCQWFSSAPEGKGYYLILYHFTKQCLKPFGESYELIPGSVNQVWLTLNAIPFNTTLEFFPKLDILSGG